MRPKTARNVAMICVLVTEERTKRTAIERRNRPVGTQMLYHRGSFERNPAAAPKTVPLLRRRQAEPYSDFLGVRIKGDRANDLPK